MPKIISVWFDGTAFLDDGTQITLVPGDTALSVQTKYTASKSAPKGDLSTFLGTVVT